MERFFLNLKMERVWQKDCGNHFEAINDIADYIVGFYNSIRLHSKLGNLSPNAFKSESTSKNLLSYPQLLDHHTFKRIGVYLSSTSFGSFSGSRVRGQTKYLKALKFVACI